MREEIKEILCERIYAFTDRFDMEMMEIVTDEITSLIERESEYDKLSKKLSQLRDMMDISLIDLAQAVHSPEYFVDLLISYQEKERESEWISVDNAISGNTYIVWFINEYGKRRVCNAIYYDKYECEASDDTDQNDDWFDVKNGIYYIPQGWYEASEYHECQMQIICDILGIIPLPNPPKSEEV